MSFFYKTSKNSEPFNWLIHHYCISAIEKNTHYLSGRLLDIGCGEKPYKSIIDPNIQQYIGLESYRSPLGFQSVDIIGDAMRLPFKDNSFDSVVSFQVLEHIPEPQKFLDEVFRVLRSGGYVIITTPFMWGEHDAPHDFFRYTRYGLKYISEKSGFKVVSIEPDTKYWSTAILRFNYYAMRFAWGPLRYLFIPVLWSIQFLALLLDKLPHNYTIDTATFTTIVQKK